MFSYCGKEKNIKDAVHIVNQDGFKNSLMELIMNTDNFTFTVANGQYIANKVYNVLNSKDICVKVYYPKWRWSSSHGYFSAAKPNDINLNGYKLKNKTLESFVGLFMHEITHMASNESHIKFDHGTGFSRNKRTPEKELSAPYLIGKFSKLLVIKARENK